MGLVLLLAHDTARAATDPYKIAEAKLAVGGVAALLDHTTLAVPKNTASAVRVKVVAGDRTLDAATVQRLLGAPFTLRAELSGPGLAQAVSLPLPNAPALADPFLIPVPPLPLGGAYTLSGIRLTAGSAVLDVVPSRATYQVLDQLLITSVKTRPLTRDEILKKGIVITDDSYLGFEFTLAVLLESVPVKISMPVVFDRQGVPAPPTIPLPPPIIRPGFLPPPLPQIVPVLLLGEDMGGGGGGGDMPGSAGGGDARIPSVLVIPGDVGYLKQHFSAQLFVANGAPAASGLLVDDITATIALPTPNPDPPLILAPTVKGTQPATMPVRGLGPDGLPETADDVTALAPGEQGQAEFLLRGELEGVHRLTLDIRAQLRGLPTGDVAVTGKATGSVLVRNPNFVMSFTVPSVVRDGERFSLFATVTNIGQSAANEVRVRLDPLALSGAQIVCLPPASAPCNTQVIPEVAVGDARTVEFVLDSQNTGAVVSSYLRFSDQAVTGGINFGLGVGERGIPLSPDTLVMPTDLKVLPAPVVRAAMRVLGQAWSIATAPADRPNPGAVTLINGNVVKQKAAALAEAGVRVQLGQPAADALRDLAFDLYGGSPIDPGFDQLLRQTRAGRDLAQAIGAAVASAASSSPATYEESLSEVAASGPDFIAISVTGRGTTVDATLSDAAGRRSETGRSTVTIPTTQVPTAVWIPLGAPATAPFLGVVTAPVLDSAYTLDLAGAADVSLTLPRAGQPFLRVTATTAFPARLIIDLRGAASVVLKEDRDGDGTYEATAPTSSASLVSRGPNLVSATVIGSETLAMNSHPMGLNLALLFDRVVDAEHAADTSRYRLTANSVRAARRQLSGRLVFATLDQPEGPYVPVKIAVAGMADSRGVLGLAAEKTIGSRLDRIGAVVSGRVLNADGTPYAGGRVLYSNTIVARAHCTSGAPTNRIAAVAAGPDGRYEFRYVQQDPCGNPFMISVRDPVNGSERSLWAYVRTPGEQMVFDLVLLGRGALKGVVRDGAGAPVAGARVVAISGSDPNTGGGALTDAAGQYIIYNLAVGQLNVTAGKGIHLGQAAGRIDRAGDTATLDVRLESGAARISGQVFKLEAGKKTPLPGIHVRYYLGTEKVNWLPVGVVQADAAGRYVLEGMPAGTFTLATDLNTRDGVRLVSYVAEEQILDQTDLVIEIPPETVYGSVSGTVRLPNGNPAGDVLVDIQGRGVVTGPDGTYTIGGVEVPANPSLRARSRDGMRSGYRHALLSDSNPHVANVDIQLSGVGTVVFTVLGPGGQPVQGQTVTILNGSGSCLDLCGCSGKATDVYGRVAFPNQPMGVVTAYAIRLEIGTTDYTTGYASLTQDGVTVFATLRFAGIGTVTGVVKDETGALLHGAEVTVISRIFRRDSREGCRWEPASNGTVRTGTDGTFRFESVPASSLKVIGRHEFTSGFDLKEPGLLGGHTLHVPLTLRSSLAGRVSGRIYQPDGVTPVGADVEVTAEGPLPPITVRTNTEGAYYFAPVLPRGRYMLTVRDPMTGAVARQYIYLSSGQASTHDVRLLGRGTIVVRVVDAAGRLADNALVRLRQTEYPSRSYEGHVRASIDDGAVTFTNVFEGPFTALATDVYGRGGRVSGLLGRPGDTAEVKVTLSATGSVTGRFLMPDGTTPISFGSIRLLAAGRVVGQTTTAAPGETAGSFAFSYVPAGPVRIEASDPATARTGFAVATLETQDQELTLDVRAQALGRVQGTVTSNGNPQPTAEVQVVSGAYRAVTMSDANGVYVIEGVPEGRITVTASMQSGLLKATRSDTLAGEGNSVTIDVALRPTGDVVGTVTKADGTTPALSVVSLVAGGLGGGRFARTTTDAGAFDFVRVPAGLADVSVDALGSIDKAALKVDVPAGETLQLPLKLNGVGSIRGRALGSSGAGTDGTLVIRVEGAFPSYYSMHLGPDGLFDLPEVLAGEFTARLTVRNGAFTLYGQAAGTVIPDQVTAIDVQLQPSGTVTGTVVRPDGTTLASGAGVTVENTQGSAFAQVQSDGRFTVKGVPLGAFKVRVVDDVMGGRATARNQELATNGQVVDVGTLMLDIVPPALTIVEPVEGQKAVGVVFTIEPTDAGGIDPSSLYVRFPSLHRQTAFTWTGGRARATAAWSCTIGLNTVWIGVDDLAGNHTETKLVYTCAGNTVRGTVRWSDGTPAPGIEVAFGVRKNITAADGTYAVTGLYPGGQYGTAKDLATGITRSAGVRVYDGEDATLNIEMPAFGKITGIVRRADGAIAPGVTVSYGSAGYSHYRSVTSGADGTFDIGWFNLGTHTIDASDSRGDKAQTSVTLSHPGHVANAGLRFTGVGSVRVNVVDGTAALAGANVTLASSSMLFSRAGVTGPDGSVTFEKILAGTITATAVDTALNRSGQATVLLVDGGTPAVTVTLAAAGRVEGTVRRVDGSPAAGIGVVLDRSRSTTTDATGRYSFAPVKVGSFSVSAVEAATTDYAETTGTLFTAGGTAIADMTLRGVGTVNVTVKDGAQALVSDAEVTIAVTGPGGGTYAHRRKTDANGFAAFANIYAGKVNISAVAWPVGGYHPETVLAPGGTLDVAIQLEDSGTIRGKVLQPDGVTPVEGAQVQLRGVGGWTTTTGVDGSYAFPRVRLATRFDLAASIAGRLRALQTGISITTNGAIAEVNLVAVGLGRVEGLVTDPSNVPAPGAAIIATSSGLYYGSVTGKTGSDGRYSLSGVPVGPFTISASRSPDRVDGAGTIAVHDATATVNLKMLSSVVAVPRNLKDGNTVMWTVQKDGRVSTSGALEGPFLTLVQAGQAFPFAPTSSLVASEDGQRETIIVQSLAGLEVSRKVFVPNDGYFVRYLDVLENRGDAPVTVDVVEKTTLGTPGYYDVNVVKTSSGDDVLAAGDQWVVVDAAEDDLGYAGSQSAPAAIVFSGPDGNAADEVTFDKVAAKEQYLSYRWNAITVQPGQRVAFLHALTYQTHRWRARGAAERLNQAPPELLAGMSAEEGALVRNFDLPADMASAAEPLMLDGIVNATPLAGDGVTAIAPNDVSILFESGLAYYGRRVYAQPAIGTGFSEVRPKETWNDAVVVPRDAFKLMLSKAVFGTTHTATTPYDFRQSGVRNLTTVLGAQFRASSFSSVPARAADSSLQTAWTAAQGDSTYAPHFKAPFFEVILPGDAVVHEIKVRGMTRPSWSYDGIRRGTVELRDAAGTVLWSTPAELPEPYRDADIAVVPPLAGVRSVRLISVAESVAGLAELEVWGEADFSPAQSIAVRPKFDGMGLVAGRVLRADGSAVPGTTLYIFKGTDSVYSGVDASGQFLYPVIPPGEYRLEATHPLGGWAVRPKVVTGTFTITAGERKDFELKFPAFGSVSGACLTAAGHPVSGAVYLTNAQGYAQSMAGTTFTFSDVPPGTYTLTAVDSRTSAKVVATIQVAANAATNQDFTFPVVGKVNVVATVGGDPLPNASVYWRSPEKAEGYSAGTTNSLGQLAILKVSGPTFTVKVEYPGNPNSFGEAVGTLAGEADEVTVFVAVPGQGTVAGVVRGRDGALVAVASQRVSVWHPTEEKELSSGNTDAAGAFSVAKVPVGPFRLRTQASDYAPATGTYYGIAEIEGSLATHGGTSTVDALVSRGALAEGQRELWTAPLKQGASTTWAAVGLSTVKPDLYLEVYDPAGTLVAANDNRSTSDTSSLVTFTAATTGEYVVSVRAVGTTSGTYRLGSGGWGGPVLRLPTTAAVHGRVLKQSSVTPVASASVRLTIPSIAETRTTTTAADGTYLFANVPTDTAVVVELLDGAGAVSKKAEAATGAAATTTSVPLTRPDLGTAIVRATYHGQPYAGLAATLTSDNAVAEPSYKVRNGVTDATGAITFTNVAGGGVTATAPDPGTGATLTASGTLTDGATLALGLAVTDVTEPAAITTLSASTPSMGVAVVSWTAVGDDGNTGTAAAYDLRYSTSPLTAANFAAATAVSAPPPAAAGTVQSVQMTLPVGHTYSFAITTRDAAGNVSVLSNVASVALLDTVAPAAVTNLSPSSTGQGLVRLQWTSPGDDASTGTAYAYEFRTSPAPITEANFAAADPVLVAVPTPAPAGTVQTVEIPLEAGETFYFALKTSDERPNWSAISNVPSFTLPGAFDGTAPVAITDLAASTPSIGVVSLAWTAPGDDGNTGTAAAYEIRYATSPITEATFGQATVISSAPTPLAAGSSQSLQLSLPMDATYYFAIKTKDEQDNWSALSNVPSVAFGDITAPARVADLAAVSAGPGLVAVRWTAPGDDGATGVAAAYDLRYSTSAITEANFDAATPVDAPLPLGAGTSQALEIARPMGEALYFALKTRDEVPNVSALSNVATVTVESLPAGVKIWVTADAGVTKDGSNYVSTWADQSGNGNHLVQATAGRKPTWVDAQVNGQPVLRFDGTDDHLKFTTRLTGVRTVFWAIHEAPTAPNGYRALLGDNVGYPLLGGAAHQIWDATYTSALVKDGETYLNGVRVDGTVTNRPTQPSVLSLVTTGPVAVDGFSADRTNLNYSWFGDLTELIVYERALTVEERRTVEDYLARRGGYASIARPAIAPHGGQLTGPTAVTITADPAAVVHYTTDGSEPAQSSPRYTGELTVSATTTLKAKAFRAGGASTTAVATFVADDRFHPAQVSGLKLWVRADAGVQESGGWVTQWTDVTGNGSMAQGTLGKQPKLVTNATTGKAAVRFDGTDDVLLFPAPITTIRTVFWLVHETPGIANSIRNLLGDVSVYPFYGGAAHQLWHPSYTSPSVLGGDTRVNGTRVDGLATNRPTVPSVISAITTGPVTADSFSRYGTYGNYWHGELAELVIYDRVLTAVERKAVEDYLAGKYATHVPRLNPPVIAPANRQFTGTLSVSMTAGPGASIYYTTDGTEPTESSTPYAGPFVVASTITVKARAYQTGWLESPVATAAFVRDADHHPAAVPGLTLWVRADSGLDTAVDGLVSEWTDQSGLGNHLTQPSGRNQPVVVPNVAGGKPVVRFDGADDWLKFTTRLTTIRTVFWVVHETPGIANSIRNLLGDVSVYPFYGGAAHQLWHPSYTSPSVLGGDTRVNGTLVDGLATNRPTAPSVISAITTGPVTADSFTRYGTYGNYWHGDLAELVIYDRVLTPTERKGVEDYLAAKYGTYLPTLNAPRLTPNGGVFTGSTAVSMTATTGATIRYTTDGSEPTASSTLYSEPVTVSTTTTVKAKAFRTGWNTSSTSVVGFTAGSEFHPASLAGLSLWVRGDAGLDEVGGAVTKWDDQSGAANHLTQPASALQPVFLSSGVSGRPTVRFDGTGDWLGFTTRLTTVRTVFWVVHETAGAGDAYRLLLGDTSSYHFHSGTAHQLWGGYASAYVTGGVTRINGLAVNGSSTNRPTAPAVVSLVTTGPVHAANFSRDRTYATYWRGDLAELVIYDRALSDGERQQVEQYLGARHGITVP